MNDRVIRSFLKSKLLAESASDPDALILEELGLRYGSGRIDIVVIRERLVGYEIKSNADSLRRLPRQVGIFSSVLSRVTLVSGDRFISKALGIVPAWWGVEIVHRSDPEEWHLVEVRQGQENPSPDRFAIAKLLWRDEALSILEEVGAANGLRSKARLKIHARLAEIMSADELQARVCEVLKHRTRQRFGAQRMSNGD